MRLGQHMLIDRNIAGRLADYADVSADDTVLEIGPGKGVLTRALVDRDATVIAIEIDRQLAEDLRNSFPNVKVIVGDARKVMPPDVNKVVSNIPYYMSTEITFRLLDMDLDCAVLMYQAEFARRLVARSGRDYSRISVKMAWRARAEILEYVPRTAFRPVPKVDSAVVRFVPSENFSVIDPEFFDRMLRVLFSHRRKVLLNVLKRNFPLDEDLVSDLLPHQNVRVEEIPPECLAEIAERIYLLSQDTGMRTCAIGLERRRS